MAQYDGPIVITAMGAVSPFGLGIEAFWSALLQGERQGTAVESGELDDQPVWGLQVGASQLDQLTKLLGKRGLQYLRPGTRFLLGAAVLAMQEAGLADGGVDPDTLGITVGSNLAGLQSMANYDYTAIAESPHNTSPMEAPNTLANAPASHLAIRLKARALNTTIASGQCAGLDALGYAAKMVRDGRARQIVAGGVEELSPAALWVYRNAQVVSSGRLDDAGLPYAVDSTGWLPSEGAATLVLERKDDALARGARPLAELVGWSSAFAPSYTLEKRSSILQKAAQQALAAAGLSPEDIDVVVAGASGYREQDQAEAIALHDLLTKDKHVPVTAIKGTLGETYGAGGLFQAIAGVCMIDRGVVPPTVGAARQQCAESPVDGLLTEAYIWPTSKQGTVLLLAQDLFGSTSAVVLKGCQG